MSASRKPKPVIRSSYLLVDVFLEVNGIERQAHGVHAVVDVLDGARHRLSIESRLSNARQQESTTYALL